MVSVRKTDQVSNARRAFIKQLTSAALVAPSISFANDNLVTNSVPRELLLHHLHTGEKLKATYWHDGAYNVGVLTSINQLLRDFRTGGVHPIDRRLLDVLSIVQVELNLNEPYEVIGGYRSAQTNAMLRKRSSGVAKRSLHMDGRAIDVRIPGFSSARLREVAADLKLGGVGYYKASNFVHLDTGRPRVW